MTDLRPSGRYLMDGPWLFRPDPVGADGELTLTSVYPNVTFEQVQENVGWKLKRADVMKPVALPMKHEISLLREKLDPKRLHIK